VLYKPESHNRNPVLIIDVHGGAWSNGHRKTGRHYDRKLAQQGFCVLAIDFRQGPDHQHPSASADICAAGRFARQTELLGFEPQQVGLLGSSSGGHLALLAGLNPDIEEHRSTLINTQAGFINADNESAAVDFVVALWPVSNPIARYQYVKARLQDDPSTWGPNFAPDRLVKGHMAYFTNQEAMSRASIQHLLSVQDFQQLPRTFVVQPDLDLNVPVFMSQTLVGALHDAGCEVMYKMYPDVAHGFAHLDSDTTDECIRDITTFIL
jgi:acetyl esterase/lipase